MKGEDSKREIEVKLRAESAAAARELLEENGFLVSKTRHFESNVLYDTAGGRLQSREEILRVRVVGAEPPILTYKGPGEVGRYKNREELELTLSDAKVFGEILRRLEMAPAFRYEKYRTEYERPGDEGLAMLDETPIGVFLELEGPPEFIDAAAAQLNYSQADYILLSYGQLFQAARAADPDLPIHMVFSWE